MQSEGFIMKKILFGTLLSLCSALSFAQINPAIATQNIQNTTQGNFPKMPKGKWHMTPEERAAHIQKMEQWCQENKDKCEKRKEEMRVRMEKVKEWCKTNPIECAKKKEEFKEKKEHQLQLQQQPVQQIQKVHDNK